jgi:exopolyphosphatase/guanosine-5'-triphosphate,3'-diphosphate pyrophosphatase
MARKSTSGRDDETYAALDLGSNNCRLLIAAPCAEGFRILDSFSRIVRLGEGVSQSGQLNDAAMARAIDALVVCAERIHRKGVSRLRAVTTHACRTAANGGTFIAAVEERTGIRLEIIGPREEAGLAAAGCLDLIDRDVKMALVLDVGGGSTELSWVDVALIDSAPARSREPDRHPALSAWLSAPLGVVTLAERFPEPAPCDVGHFRRLIEAVRAELARFSGAQEFQPIFRAGQAHIIGTSGAITSLAGLYLDLAQYDRSQVDGLWMTRDACEAVAKRLMAHSIAERARLPCVGPDRADLVLAGAAILQAVQELWPSDRVRVADRGLREGLLLSMMAERSDEHRAGAAWTPAECRP